MAINISYENLEKLERKVKLCRDGALAGTLVLALALTGCNRSVFDTKYGFDQALTLGDDSAIILDVESWKDYSGEQIQLTTTDNFVLLTSAFDTHCFYGDSDRYSIEKVAAGAVQSEDIYHLTKNENGEVIYNKDILDTNWHFNKSITFNGNNALILPVGEWKDYSGEQLQVITNDGLVLVLSSYNSKLAYDANSSIKAYDYAQSYVGSDGKVVDLSKDNSISFNYDMIDTKLSFNKALIMKEGACVIVPITEWCDYEGEQLQIKIKNGPTLVTAAYDTILLNDINSKIKAIDIANGLSSKVVDLADDYSVASVFNKQIIDFDYGYSNAILSNDNSSSALKIEKWCDYEGEQLQIELSSGDVVLTSSMMLDLVNGGTSKINASSLSEYYVDENGKNIDKSNSDISVSTYNKYILDLEQSFKYALKIIDGNVTIIPLKKWTDFYNNDGGENEADSPNCEQIQLILPDDTVLVTTAYNTLLVDNITDIEEIAQLLKGPNGVITNLSKYVGEPSINGWNLSLIDTKYRFNYAILSNGQTSQVFPLYNWLDFKEGEQLQLNLIDDTGFLTSFVNTTLVYSENDGIEKIIAKAFSGSLENEKKLDKTYQ